MNKLAFLCFIILFTSCLKKKENIESNIESIYVEFYNYSFNSVVAINCNEIKKHTIELDSIPIEDDEGNWKFIANYQCVLDTMIKDQSVLYDIEKEINNLVIINDSLDCIDGRISCLIKYKNGQEKDLCIGGYFADEISFNKKNVYNNKLLYLIKNNINYYNWMSDDILRYSKELNDSTFQRGLVEGRSGKLY